MDIYSATGMEAFEKWFEKANKLFLDNLQNVCPSLASISKLSYKVNKKYIKVMVNENGKDCSVWAFINRTNGDVLKAASWNAPAKHARGNVFDEWGGMRYITAYGPVYLKK